MVGALLGLLGCDRGASPEPPVLTRPEAGPVVVSGPAVADPGPQVALALELTVSTDVPTALELRLEHDDGVVRTITFPGEATDHAVPLLGFLPNTTGTVTVRLTDAQGRTTEPAPVPFDAGPGPALDDLPEFVLHGADPSRMEPGYTLLPAKYDDVAWILAVDAAANVVYAQETSLSINSVTPTPSGDLVMVDKSAVRQVDWLGRTRHRWTNTLEEPADVEVPFGDFHHDVFPLADGSFFALVYEHADVPEYPVSYSRLDEFRPATIRNDAVTHVAADGSVLGYWPMLDLLDPRHIGFDGLAPDPSGALDWVHANAVIYDEPTGDVLVSLRHQDAVVRFSAASGEIRWILGAPEGWDPALVPYILTMAEPFARHTHQHAIELDEGGVLRMFDNGNDLRSTPYYSSGQTQEYSRILELQIDPDAGTVRQLAEYGQTASGPVYALSLGNADRLPVTSNRMATYGTVPRIVEWTADKELVFDLQLVPGRWRVDRALRIASLYGPGVVEIVE